jgi:DNA processing protein
MRGAHTIRRGDEGWPRALDLLSDSPEFLRVRGALPVEGERAVAVVGSRNASAAGLEMARSLGGALARAGAWVISGGAVGIDAAAHTGAIESGGRTAVVLGGGLDHLYPAVNRGLFARVVESGGGLLAEVDDGTHAETWSFPRRNRIVAALGEVTVVVRAGAGSGALITARHAARIGQPVWVAADVTGVEGEGLRCLAAEGAAEFRTAAGLASALRLEPVAEVAPGALDPAGLVGMAAALWEALDALPRGADEVAQRAGVGPGAVLAGLMELELLGLVERRPGRGFTRRAGSAQGE